MRIQSSGMARYALVAFWPAVTAALWVVLSFMTPDDQASLMSLLATSLCGYAIASASLLPQGRTAAALAGSLGFLAVLYGYFWRPGHALMAVVLLGAWGVWAAHNDAVEPQPTAHQYFWRACAAVVVAGLMT